MLCFHLVQGSRFRGEVAASPLFLLGRCPKVVFKSRFISHNNDMSSPLEQGRAKGAGWICPAGASFYVAENVLLAGIVSHVWHEILRLSPHLFWLFFSHIERFRSLRMTIREGGWTLIWEICCVFWNYRCYIRYE